MSEYPPTACPPSHRPPYSLADLVQEFVIDPGWTQLRVAEKMDELEKAIPHDQRPRDMKAVSNSCLSRWKKETDKQALRHQFTPVAYAAILLDWESSGRSRPKPGLSDVSDLWDQRHPSPPFRTEVRAEVVGGEAEEATATQQRSDPAPNVELMAHSRSRFRSKANLSDSAQIKALRSYGTAGVNLLTAARAGDKMAALDFGLLRTLDGHRREGEGWFRAAHFEGFPATSGTDGEIAVGYGAPLTAVAQVALERASELPDDDSCLERKALLLEKAATHKTPRAVDLLAAYFEDQGESGAAARWRIAMN